MQMRNTLNEVFIATKKSTAGFVDAAKQSAEYLSQQSKNFSNQNYNRIHGHGNVSAVSDQSKVMNDDQPKGPRMGKGSTPA